MASITNQSQAREARWLDRIWNALKDLGFISSFFSWFFALLARLAEPLLMLSTMYVIAETAVPALHSLVMQGAAIAIMVTVPEIILPGSFVIATKEAERGSRLAGLLQVMCWAFVALMLATIADVLIFHFIGMPLAILMFVRCGVAVGYSVLMRVLHHGQSPALSVATPDIVAMIAALDERVQSIPTVPPAQVQLADIEEAIERRLAQVHYPDVEAIMAGYIEHLDRVQVGRLETIVRRVTEQVSVTIERATGPHAVVSARAIEPPKSPIEPPRIAPPEVQNGDAIAPPEGTVDGTVEESLDGTRGTVGERVYGYIEQQAREVHVVPTLPQIMAATGCSRGTARAQRNRYTETCCTVRGDAGRAIETE